MNYVSPAEERLKQQSHHAEIASKTPEDLEKLKDEVSALRGQREGLKDEIAKTKTEIRLKNEELTRLKTDIFAPIDKRARECVEAEMQISLLQDRERTLNQMLGEVEEHIPGLIKIIVEIERHFQLEEYTQKIEQFFTEEFLPTQQAHAEKWRILQEMLKEPHYLKNFSNEMLRNIGNFDLVIKSERRYILRRA